MLLQFNIGRRSKYSCGQNFQAKKEQLEYFIMNAGFLEHTQTMFIKNNNVNIYKIYELCAAFVFSKITISRKM